MAGEDAVRTAVDEIVALAEKRLES